MRDENMYVFNRKMYVTRINIQFTNDAKITQQKIGIERLDSCEVERCFIFLFSIFSESVK